MKSVIRTLISAVLSVLTGATALADAPHNLILFMPNGLRAQIVDAATGPAMAR